MQCTDRTHLSSRLGKLSTLLLQDACVGSSLSQDPRRETVFRTGAKTPRLPDNLPVSRVNGHPAPDKARHRLIRMIAEKSSSTQLSCFFLVLFHWLLRPAVSRPSGSHIEGPLLLVRVLCAALVPPADEVGVLSCFRKDAHSLETSARFGFSK